MPDNDGYIDVKIVIEGQWYLLRFNFDNERFTDYTKICLPDIHISDKGIPVFSFAVEYPYIYKEISSEYIVGVDVGISNYATVVVTDSDGNIVHASTLSENVHSLTNSIQATQRQIAYLHTKRNAYLIYSNEYHDITQEIALHRKANINKKQELAIKTAQEIAYISYVFDNAVVVFEELSWVRNTMCNGRWNRGELFKKTKEYVELNGGRIIKVSAYNTSQECCSCHKKVMFHDYHTAICKDCDVVIDRDVNAAANIANRARKTVEKCTKTRKKAKKFNKDKKRKDLRTPIPTSMKKKRGSSTTRKKGKKTGKCYNKKQAKQFYLGKQKYKEVMTVNKNHGTDAHNDDVKVSSDEQNTEAILIQDSQKATRKYATLNSNATIA